MYRQLMIAEVLICFKCISTFDDLLRIKTRKNCRSSLYVATIVKYSGSQPNFGIIS